MLIRLLFAAALVVVTVLLVVACGGQDDARPDLAFVSTRDGPYAVYEMNADGGGQRRLTDADTDTSEPRGLFFQVEPAWAPDGKRIAFASKRSGTFDIYVMNADGTGTRRLTSTREDDSNPTWSPDGKQIAFARGDDGDIYMIKADGTGARPILEDPSAETQPAWSPNGGWIAYVKRAPGTDVRELWLVRPNGSGDRRLTSLRAPIFSPAWSPDGTRIAFASNVVGPLYDIFTFTLGRNGVRRVTDTGPDAFEPAWSPDGKTIAFSRGGAIVTIDLAGNEEEITDRDNNDSSPAWNPRPLEATG